MKIAKIVSGGQTGVDQGALDACRWIEFPSGGWVPKGRRTESGTLQDKYKGMQEHTSEEYLARTEANVVDSDATLIMTHGKPSGGSKKTVEFAKKHKRSWHHLDMSKPMDTEVGKAMTWIKDSCPDNCVLNVTGTRESKKPGIQKATLVWVLEISGRTRGSAIIRR